MPSTSITDPPAAKYIDAFFANVQWDTVAKRMAQALETALGCLGE